MAGKSFDHTLADDTKLLLNEFGGQRRLHIRKFKDGYATHTGICIPERQILHLLDIKFDIDRAFAEKRSLVYKFDDYLSISTFSSGTVDFRYTYRRDDGKVLYSKYKGITLKRDIVVELFDILCKEYTILY